LGVTETPDPSVVAAVRRMVDELAGRPDHLDLAHRLEALIELLVAGGQLSPGHRVWIEELHGERQLIKLAVGGPKRSLPSPDIDCASRIALCHGRCCALTVSLSREDLDEGRLRFDVHDPYVLRKDPDTGYCSYLGGDGCCAVYDDRPATCRAYDCRRDPRVWIDYDARIAAPLPPHLVPLGTWPT
jgi:Fe-S-cluster containining protein